MNVSSEKVLSIPDDDYQNWIKDLKMRYRQSQIKAAVRVNGELIRFYWSLGRDIVQLKSETRWGGGFYVSLSKDLKRQFEDSKGFSVRNLHAMRQFYELFPGDEIMQQVAAQIVMVPWGHILVLLTKCRGNPSKALFYIRKSVEHGWSRSMLSNYLDANLYERQGKAINNFEMTMLKEESDLAKEITKDPYSFNFLALDED